MEGMIKKCHVVPIKKKKKKEKVSRGLAKISECTHLFIQCVRNTVWYFATQIRYNVMDRLVI